MEHLAKSNLKSSQFSNYTIDEYFRRSFPYVTLEVYNQLPIPIIIHFK